MQSVAVMTMLRQRASSDCLSERVNRRHYVTRSEARADIFDYIERFYNRRKTRKLEQTDQTALN